MGDHVVFLTSRELLLGPANVLHSLHGTSRILEVLP
jgi:hypothetical protein